MIALLVADAAQASVPRLDPAFYTCRAATAENIAEPPPPVWQLKGDPPPKPSVVEAQRPAADPCPAGQVAEPKFNGSAVAPPIVRSPRRPGTIAPSFTASVGQYAPYYYAGDGWDMPSNYAGMSVALQVGTPSISPGGHSLAQIGLAADGANNNRTIEFGWHVEPGLYGGSTASHLFLYVNKDHYASHGQPGGDCYNCQFVPLAHATYHLGQVLNASATALDFTVASTSEMRICC